MELVRRVSPAMFHVTVAMGAKVVLAANSAMVYVSIAKPVTRLSKIRMRGGSDVD